jgi:hypothetical protein
MEANQATSTTVCPALDEMVKNLRALKQYDLSEKLNRLVWEYNNSHRGEQATGAMLNAIGASIAVVCRCADGELAAKLAEQLAVVCRVMHPTDGFRAYGELARFWSSFSKRFAYSIDDNAAIGVVAMTAYALAWATTSQESEADLMFREFLAISKVHDGADIKKAIRAATEYHVPTARLLKTIGVLVANEGKVAPVIAKTLVTALTRYPLSRRRPGQAGPRRRQGGIRTARVGPSGLISRYARQAQYQKPRRHRACRRGDFYSSVSSSDVGSGAVSAPSAGVALAGGVGASAV